MKFRYAPRPAAALALLLFAAACDGGGSGGSQPPPIPTPTIPPQGKIRHVVIIFQENRSVDNLFNGLPGADTTRQGMQPGNFVTSFDLDHSHPGFVRDYDGGKLDGFQTNAYGYVPQSQVQPYWTMAEQYTFADRMFQTNQGPSFPAHQYIIAGTSLPSPGSNLHASENPSSGGGCDSAQGSLVAMIDPAGSEAYKQYPCFDHATLMDLLDQKGISWRYYVGGSPAPGLWNAPDAISHIRQGADYAKVVGPNTIIYSDIRNGTLAQVSWIIPTGAESDHPRSTDGSGPSYVASIVNAVGNSPYWNDTAILVAWDDWGGWYDHVAPAMYNSYELGFRVPLIVVSPYARVGYVSHVQHEFGSIVHFVETQFGLGSLGYTDARADDLSDCFNFSQAPTGFRTIQSARRAAYFEHLPPDSAPPDSDL